MKNRVLLDTNALLVPGTIGIDIFEELEKLLGSYEAVVPDFVISELKSIAKSGEGRSKVAAKFALELLKKVRVLKTEQKGRVDEAIANIAKENNFIVFTNDKELRQSLKAKGVKVIYLRQMKYLELVS